MRQLAVLLAVALALPAAAHAQDTTRTVPARDSTRTEQGDSIVRRAPPPAPVTRADTLRALRERLDTVKIDGEPVEQPNEELSVGTGPAWRTSYFPYITGGSGGGPLLAVRIRRSQPAEFEDRVTTRGALSLDMGIGLKGNRFVTARFNAPLLTRNLRTVLTASAIRETRFGFYGFGNGTELDDARVEADEDAYRVHRTRYLASAEVSRRIKGPLYISGLAGVESARFYSLSAGSEFGGTYGGELSETDVIGRLALVLDTRNNEFNTRQGMLLDVGIQGGTGGDGYRRVYGIATGYLPLRATTTIAARIGAANISSGTPPLNARFSIPAWEDPITIYGGGSSNRGLVRGRFTGTGVLFTNFEVRQDLYPLGTLGYITVIGFVDAGRVFENEGFRITTDGMHVGAGGGLAIRLLRSSIFTATFARGSDGFKFSAGSGWMF